MSGTVLLTGACGFIGRHMSHLLSSEGWRIVGVDLVPPENAPLASLSRYVQLRLPDAALDQLLKAEQPSACIHCAGRASVGLSFEDPVADYYSGPVVTLELLSALRRCSPGCRMVFLSSAAVYGQPESLPVDETSPAKPISPYGFHKLQCELLCKEFSALFGLHTCSLRVFSAYGPGLRRQVIWDICYKLLTECKLSLHGDGSESRDFVHVRDVVEAVRTVLSDSPMSGEAYNVASGEATTIRSLAEKIVKMLGTKATVEFDGVVPVGTPVQWCGNTGKLRALGFKPTVRLDGGLRGVTRWCRSEITGF